MRLIIRLLILTFTLNLFSCSWVSEANQTAREEFGAKGSLKKYEWFKDCSNTIDEKLQTIKVYEQNIKLLEESYKEVERRNWDTIDKQQYNQWRAEITGMKASYNKVVKEYNSQSSKFNWSFYNTSQLPKTYTLYLDN